MLEVRIEKVDLIPTKTHSTDAGLDLKAKEDYCLDADTPTLVGTGVQVKIPKGYVGLLFPRSSLSKRGIILTNSVGVIDSDYRGEIKASLCYIKNNSNLSRFTAHTHIEKYERIVQLVIVPIVLTDIEVIHCDEEEWNDTARGYGGFGSTGR